MEKVTTVEMVVNGKTVELVEPNGKVFKTFRHCDGKFMYELQNYKEDFPVFITNEREAMLEFNRQRLNS